jgi:hypothetical protein
MRDAESREPNNERPGVDAGWAVLFALLRAWPRVTKADRWDNKGA